MANFTRITKSDLGDFLFQALDTAEAKVNASGDTRWVNAFAAAADYLHAASSVAFDAEHNALLVESASGNGHYIANGACQCAAYVKSAEPKACWHRAAARIVARALELKRSSERYDRALADLAECFA
jgi:hypothetical protein